MFKNYLKPLYFDCINYGKFPGDKSSCGQSCREFENGMKNANSESSLVK